jgi:hypothetical protein
VLASVIVLDNKPPVASLGVNPLPAGSDSVTGEVYVPKVVIRGAISDGESGLSAATLIVRNDSGEHVQNSPVGLSPAYPTFSRIVHLVPGRNIVDLVAVDRAGNADTARAVLTYVIPKAAKLMQTGGGSLRSPNGASVSVPSGALDHAVEITLRPADPAEEAKPINPDVKLLGAPMEFGPDHTQFRQGVLVTLAYTDADLDPDQDGVPNIDLAKLTIVFWDGQTWVKAGAAKLDASRHTLSVEVNHFTLFDLAEDNSPTPTDVKAWWSSNPIRTSQGGVFHFKLPESGKISLYILDMAGDVVRQLIPEGSARAAGEGSWSWNGDNVSGSFAGAGLYVYVFRFAPDSGKAKTLIRKPVGLVHK